ncbi:leucine-rich PPR motif-containing protein, mitochondrial-like [Morone saxatilis]|uniref:leucine-rich PPR motif-containing protein, mitochondrial-like n=1 Tax=Morone saxatilis TaxID=34816 RepID=UPI0015E251E5|nr:leucine-rich PPR motif-containing protein, mitochondrial-like [Morone saxatilis]
MVKITALLYNDKRFQKKSPKTTEEGSFFLYSLIDSMSEREVHAKEEQLKTYFNQLQSENITIPKNIYRGIKNLLESYHIPELIKDVAPLQSREAGFRTTDNYGRMRSLKTKMSELKAANQPLDGVLKQMIQACIEDEKPQAALNLMQEHENEITTSIYITLIRMCCRHNYVNQALKLKKEMSLKDPTVTLDVNRYLELVRLLSRNGRVEVIQAPRVSPTGLCQTTGSVVDQEKLPSSAQQQDTDTTLFLSAPPSFRSHYPHTVNREEPLESPDASEISCIQEGAPRSDRPCVARSRILDKNICKLPT